MHLSLWVGELMANAVDEKPAPMEGTPSSSLELLDIGSLAAGAAQLALMAEDNARPEGLQGLVFGED